MIIKPGPEDALLIIDMQKDFLPGGALPVTGSDQLIPLINRQIQRGFSTVITTRDRHPANHVSFKTEGGPWPSHCVAGTSGAELDPRLILPPSAKIFDKGMDASIESYSAFTDSAGRTTGLTAYLRNHHIKRVYLCGVALDYCVKESALDSVKAGFETHLIASLTRAVNDPAPILDELKNHHIVIQ